MSNLENQHPTIESISFENFKSYQESVLPLSPLTLLIGANASGKSNSIEAIRFLSWLAHGRRLDDIVDKVQQTDIVVRGTLKNLIYNKSEVNTLSLGCSFTGLDEWQKLFIQIKFDSEKEIRISNEKITSEFTSVPLYEIKYPAQGFTHEVQVAYNNFARGGRKPVLPCTDRQAIFTQLDIPSRFNEGPAREKVPDITQKIQKLLKDIIFLDPNPRNMTEYSFSHDKELEGDGSNLSSTLFDLCEIQNKKNEVLDFIKSLPEQDIIDIRFLETPRNEVMVQLIESFGNTHSAVDAPLLSDGTLRVLAVAAALMSSTEGSLVIIEEIDNGVHPSRANILLNNIQSIAKERNLRVLLTSHNPALLDTLPTDAIPNVVCCYRDPEHGDSKLIKLADIPDYPNLVASGPLGSLMTRGVIDQYLKRQKTDTGKKEKAKKWLSDLEKRLKTYE